MEFYLSTCSSTVCYVQDLCVAIMPFDGKKIKPRLHERFFARAGDATFSNFVA